MIPILIQYGVLNFYCVRMCNDDSGTLILEDVAASLGTLWSCAMPSVVFTYLSTSAMHSTSAVGLVANTQLRLVANSPFRKELFSWMMLELMLEFGVWQATNRWAAGIRGNSWLSSIPNQKARLTQTEVFYSFYFSHVFDWVSCVPWLILR